MSNIIHLEEILFAKAVVREVPNAVKALDKCLELCYPNDKYFDIAKVILQIQESKLMLELTLEAYKMVLKENGVKSE